MQEKQQKTHKLEQKSAEIVDFDTIIATFWANTAVFWWKCLFSGVCRGPRG